MVIIQSYHISCQANLSSRQIRAIVNAEKKDRMKNNVELHLLIIIIIIPLTRKIRLMNNSLI